jgi:alpha-glucosidase
LLLTVPRTRVSKALFFTLIGESVKKLWWHDAVVYQIYPRSFADSNNDGEGDFAGITSRLEHVASLGADAVWFSPFYKSPNKDGGYDVADPRAIDPRFGTLADFKTMKAKADQLGIKVVVDIVPNHFSDQHLWFQAALNSTPNSNERMRFHFYDGKGEAGELPPNNWQSIFGGASWTRITEIDGKLGQWYLHLFDSSQPDLNWENPEVQADFAETIKFWLDQGVSGFRIDVAHGLAKDEIYQDHPDPDGLTAALRLDSIDIDADYRKELLSNIPFFDREGVHQIYRNWRKQLDSYPGDQFFVAEAWVYPSSRAARYVRADELHQIFNFDFLSIEWNAQAIKSAIDLTLRELGEVDAPATWVLCNHDSPRVVTRFGGGTIGTAKARALALLTQALPGNLYIYQGEELGLEDAPVAAADRQDPIYFRTKGAQLGRDGVRVPIPWEGEVPPFGFSAGNSWLPAPAVWRNLTVEAQNLDPTSMLNLYRSALRIRKEHPGLGGTDPMHWVDSSPEIIWFRREAGFELVGNTGELDFEFNTTKKLLLASDPNIKLIDGKIVLPPNCTVWLTA